MENLWKLDEKKTNNPIKKTNWVLFKNAKVLKDRVTGTWQLSDPENAGAEGNHPERAFLGQLLTFEYRL